MLRHPWLLVLLALAITAASPPAWAATPDELMDAGKKALRAGDGAAAKKAFEDGLALAEPGPPRWRMQLGLALALVLDEQLVEAAHAYRAFLRDAESHPEGKTARWPERRTKARDDLRRLERTILEERARVDIQSDPLGARVSIDGKSDPRWVTPVVVYLEPGEYELVLRRDGFAPDVFSVVVEPGLKPVFHRHLEKPRPPAPPPATPAPPPVRPTPSPTPAPPAAPADYELPGLLALAAGAALALGGGAVHWTALRDADEVIALQDARATEDTVARDRALRDRIDSYQIAYVTLYVAGGLGLAAGATLMIVDALVDGGADDDSASVSAWLAEDTAGVVVTGRF